MANSNRMALYNDMSQHDNFGTFDQFNEALDNPDNMQAAYDFMKDKGDYGTFDDFAASMTRDDGAFELPNPAATAPVQESVSTPPLSMPYEEPNDLPLPTDTSSAAQPVDTLQPTGADETTIPESDEEKLEVFQNPLDPENIPQGDYSALSDIDEEDQLDFYAEKAQNGTLTQDDANNYLDMRKDYNLRIGAARKIADKAHDLSTLSDDEVLDILNKGDEYINEPQTLNEKAERLSMFNSAVTEARKRNEQEQNAASAAQQVKPTYNKKESKLIYSEKAVKDYDKFIGKMNDEEREKAFTTAIYYNSHAFDAMIAEGNEVDEATVNKMLEERMANLESKAKVSRNPDELEDLTPSFRRRQLHTTDYDEKTLAEIAALQSVLSAKQNGEKALTLQELEWKNYRDNMTPEQRAWYDRYNKHEAGIKGSYIFELADDDKSLFTRIPDIAMRAIDILVEEVEKKYEGRMSGEGLTEFGKLTVVPSNAAGYAAIKRTEMLKVSDYTNAFNAALKAVNPDDLHAYILYLAEANNCSLSEAQDKFVEGAYSVLRKKVIDKFAPSTNGEYFVKTAFENTMWGLMLTIFTEKDVDFSHINPVTVSQEADALYKSRNNGWAGKFAQWTAPAVGIAADTLTGGFWGGQLVGKGVSKLAAKLSTLALVGRGAGAAGEKIAMQRLIGRVAVSAAGSSATLATYSGYSSAAHQKAFTGVVDTGEVWKSVAHGAALGLLTGITHPSLQYFTRGMKGYKVVLAEAANVLSVGTIFTGAELVTEGKTSVDSFVTNTIMGLSSILTNPVEYADAVSRRMKGNSRKDLRTIYISPEEKTALEGKYPTIAKILAGEFRRSDSLSTLKEEYERMKQDKDVTVEQFRMAAYIVDNVAIPAASPLSFSTQRNADGKWVVTAYTGRHRKADGRAIDSGIVCKDEKEKKKITAALRDEVERNRAAQDETSARLNEQYLAILHGLDNAVSEINKDGDGKWTKATLYGAYIIAKQKGKGKLSVAEKAIINAVEKNATPIEKPAVDTIYSDIKDKYGVDVLKAMEKPLEKRTKQEKKAISELKARMSRMISDQEAEQQEFIQKAVSEQVIANEQQELPIPEAPPAEQSTQQPDIVVEETSEMQKARNRKPEQPEVMGMLDQDRPFFGGTKTMDTIDKVAKKLGLRIRLYQGPSDQDGYHWEGTIWVNKNASKEHTIAFVLGHEMTHFLKKNRAQVLNKNEFQDIAEAYYKKKYGEKFGDFFQARKERYKKSSVEQELSDEGVWEELYCDLVGRMLENDTAARQVFRDIEDKTTAQKVYLRLMDFIDNMLNKFGIGRSFYTDRRDSLTKIFNEIYGVDKDAEPERIAPRAEEVREEPKEEPVAEQPQRVYNGRPADIDDVKKLYPDEDFDNVEAEEIDRTIEMLESDRQLAHDYAEGRTDKMPYYYDHWAERDGLDTFGEEPAPKAAPKAEAAPPAPTTEQQVRSIVDELYKGASDADKQSLIDDVMADPRDAEAKLADLKEMLVSDGTNEGPSFSLTPEEEPNRAGFNNRKEEQRFEDAVGILNGERTDEFSKRAAASVVKDAINEMGGVTFEGKPMRDLGPKFSLSAMFEGIGADPWEKATDDKDKTPRTDKDGNFAVTIGDKVFNGHNLLSVDDIRGSDTPLEWMIQDSLSMGLTNEERVNNIRQRYVDMLNIFLKAGLKENLGVNELMNEWQFVADTVFRTVAENGDAQYAKSVDIMRICKKNEQIIYEISELQLRQGFGVTPAQILDLYYNVIDAGFQPPCPVCYVFSRYIRRGQLATAAINGMRIYGKHLKGGEDPWTLQQWKDEAKRLQALKDKKKAKEFVEENPELAKQLRISEERAKANEKAYNNADKAVIEIPTKMDALRFDILKAKTPEERAKMQKEIEELDRQYREAVQIWSSTKLDNWIKTMVIDGKQVYKDATLPEDMENFEQCALDTRRLGEVQMKYPGIVRLNRSLGSAGGKEMSFASNNDIGELVSGLAVGKPNDKTTNKYLIAQQKTTRAARYTARKNATQAFKAAAKYVAMQNLRGGVRMWSWSDNIERLSPDVAVNLMQLELLGGGVQTYSKQLEGIELVASMGAYVNGSLMAHGSGYMEVNDTQTEMRNGVEVLKAPITEMVERKRPDQDPVTEERTLAAEGSQIYIHNGKKYVAVFDDVVGIPFEGRNGKMGLRDLNEQFDTAGNIIVGMNDLHIRTCLNDPRIFFCIPWHSSGANQHILNQMFDMLAQGKVERTDYTKQQEETDYASPKDDGSMKTISEGVRRLWAEFKDESDRESAGLPSIDSNGETITASQLHYRGLREKIFDGTIEKDPKALAEVKADRFLKQCYEAVKNKAGGQMTKKDNEYIYPYEYWDKSSNYGNADINGRLYIEYCRRLGKKPKFCGKDAKGMDDVGDFTHDKGYWKLLIDRRMYNRRGEYQDIEAIDSKNMSLDTFDSVKNREKYDVSEVARGDKTAEIVDATLKRERERFGELPTFTYGTDLDQAINKDSAPQFSLSTERFSDDKEMQQAAKEYNETIRINQRRAERKGQDYYPTPAPLALVASRLLHAEDGMSVLDIGSGDGMLHKFLKGTNVTAVENSPELAEMNRTNTGANVIQNDYLDVDDGKKYQRIITNPPYGQRGADAFSHASKGYEELEDGGRMVAILPMGSNADRLFNNFAKAVEADGSRITADIELPSCTFYKAGIHGSRTRMVVIDKGVTGETKHVDLSDIRTNQDLYESIYKMDIDADGNVTGVNNPQSTPKFSFTHDKKEFGKVLDEAVKSTGIVLPNLADKAARVVDVPQNHPFDISLPYTELKRQVVDYAKTQGDKILGDVNVEGGIVNISITSLQEMADKKSLQKSERNGVGKDIHLAALLSIKDIIGNSIDCEIHPDYLEDEKHVRSPKNGHLTTTMMHVFYGAIKVDGNYYSVRSLVKETKGTVKNKAYMYALEGIELDANPGYVQSKTPQMQTNSIPLTKLIQGVDKSYDHGKLLLDESPKTTETSSDKVIFTANNVVDPAALEAKYPSELPNKYYHHSTNKFEPGQPFDEREGTRQTLKITGRLTTDKVDVLVVDNPNSSNEIPHITLATAEGVKPAESNAELQKHRDEIVPLDDVVETEFRNNFGRRKSAPSFSISQNVDDAMRNQGPAAARAVEQERSIRDQMRDFLATTTDLDEPSTRRVTALLNRAMSNQRQYDKVTVDAITKLAKDMMDSGLLSGMTDFETKQLLTRIKNANGRTDITPEVNRLMDVMLNHQVKQGKNTFNQLLRTKGQRVDSNGVQVAAGLDASGVRMLNALRKGAALDFQSLDAAINDAESRANDPNANELLKKNAKDELDGLLAAREHALYVRSKEAELAEAKAQLDDAQQMHAAGMMSNKDFSDYKHDAEEQIRAIKASMVEGYERVNGLVGYELGESAGAAKEFREKQKQHQQEIYHDINRDIQGRDADPYHRKTNGEKRKDRVASSIQFVTRPLQTFDYMMRWLGSKFSNGEGNLFKRFMKQAIDARDNDWKGYSQGLQRMNDKVAEILGEGKQWADLYKKSQQLNLSVNIHGLPHDITQGAACAIYAWNKQADGRTKLRYMGISEDDVNNLVQQIDPDLLKVTDWLQQEFFPELRTRYNEVYKRMFGTDMDNIENYFPLRINPLEVEKKDALGSGGDNSKLSTIAGGIIKRTHNNKGLDVINADAFNIAVEHLQEMEHWMSYAELARDLNTMLGYNRLRAMVENSSSLRYGSGKDMMKALTRCCELVTGDFRPEGGSAIDKQFNKWTSRMAAANIAFRYYTGLKQTLSWPVYFTQARTDYLLQNSFTRPLGSFRWAIDNLPTFAERWQSRKAGDPLLDEIDLTQGPSAWRNFLKATARMGMSWNAAVDAFTVAAGARSIYMTRKARYISDGYAEDVAEQKALLDAAISVNETQQSSQGMFVSPMQRDITFLSKLSSIYRNASMGYERKFVNGLNSVRNFSSKEWRDECYRVTKDMAIRDGLTEAQAERVAARAVRRELTRGIADLAMFGYIAPIFWALGSEFLPQLLGGTGNDDDHENAIKKAFMHGFTGPIEGLVGGATFSQAADFAYDFMQGDKDWRDWRFSHDLMSDMAAGIVQKAGSKPYEALYDFSRMAMAMTTGVDPRTFTNIVVAFVDAFDHTDKQSLGWAQEGLLLFNRLLNTPESQLEKVYIDEVMMSAKDAKQLSPEDFAQRFAKVKRLRGAGWWNVFTSAETDKEVEDKYIKKYKERLKDAISEVNEERMREFANIEVKKGEETPMLKSEADKVLKESDTKMTRTERAHTLDSLGNAGEQGTLDKMGLEQKRRLTGQEYGSYTKSNGDKLEYRKPKDNNKGALEYERRSLHSDIAEDISLRMLKDACGGDKMVEEFNALGGVFKAKTGEYDYNPKKEGYDYDKLHNFFVEHKNQIKAMALLQHWYNYMLPALNKELAKGGEDADKAMAEIRRLRQVAYEKAKALAGGEE